MVSSAWRVVPRILKRANVGTDDKCNLPRVLVSIRSVQATSTSETVTDQNKLQILLFFFWRGDDTQNLISLYTDGIHNDKVADFSAMKFQMVKTVNVAALSLAIFVTASVIYKKSSASNKLNCNF